MSEHVISIQTQLKCDGAGEPTGYFRYRWNCTCSKTGAWYGGGKRSGGNRREAVAASRSGAQHVSSSCAEVGK